MQDLREAGARIDPYRVNSAERVHGQHRIARRPRRRRDRDRLAPGAVGTADPIHDVPVSVGDVLPDDMGAAVLPNRHARVARVAIAGEQLGRQPLSVRGADEGSHPKGRVVDEVLEENEHRRRRCSPPTGCPSPRLTLISSVGISCEPGCHVAPNAGAASRSPRQRRRFMAASPAEEVETRFLEAARSTRPPAPVGRPSPLPSQSSRDLPTGTPTSATRLPRTSKISSRAAPPRAGDHAKRAGPRKGFSSRLQTKRGAPSANVDRTPGLHVAVAFQPVEPVADRRQRPPLRCPAGGRRPEPAATRRSRSRSASSRPRRQRTNVGSGSASSQLRRTSLPSAAADAATTRTGVGSETHADIVHPPAGAAHRCPSRRRSESGRGRRRRIPRDPRAPNGRCRSSGDRRRRGDPPSRGSLPRRTPGSPPPASPVANRPRSRRLR